MAAVEVDWTEYFCSIQKVCPWSWAAWQKGEILITVWKGTKSIKNIPLGYQAVVHLSDHNSRQLKKLSDNFNNTRDHEEWLWSHPKYKGYSTPVPVLIQQDRKLLEMARKKALSSNFV